MITRGKRKRPARTIPYLTVIATGTLILGACSGPGVNPADGGPFPARPYTLDVTQIAPCSTLTEEQARERGAESGGPGEADVGAGKPSRTCGWNNFEDGYGYNFQTVEADASQALAAPGATVEVVNGFGAVLNVPDESALFAGPGIPLICQLTIDVNNAESIRVQVQSSDPGSFGVEKAKIDTCGRAKVLASDVLTTLASQQR